VAATAVSFLRRAPRIWANRLLITNKLVAPTSANDPEQSSTTSKQAGGLHLHRNSAFVHLVTAPHRHEEGVTRTTQLARFGRRLCGVCRESGAHPPEERLSRTSVFICWHCYCRGIFWQAADPTEANRDIFTEGSYERPFLKISQETVWSRVIVAVSNEAGDDRTVLPNFIDLGNWRVEVFE
jgi:hypothetical protein